MSKKSEDTSSVSPMATGVDPSIRAILDAMQKQNEIKLRKLLKETIKAATSRSYQGAHDPKLNNKIKGFVTEKLERFHDNKSIACAECSVSMCTKNASNVTITFRTPQAPRKHNQDQTRSSSKVKLRELITANDQKLNYDPEHQLADLQVECSDKDRTTQELEKHIEDMKEEKQLEKKLADAYEEVEEQRQVVGQWKRRVQSLNDEMHDLRLLLEEQTARNNLLEKKQRKFDSETQNLMNDLRQEKTQRKRLAREKEIAIAE
ncbi:myosin-2 heavy chain, non muscle-like [Bombus huntii]|uniref:myosin-2 heavy chain, non muscle-like n=1 Tax=Bombus huntii TaxID=85661 RepID=UPI0021AA5719|nr:myosin-2 heavy chain, non muscle-like [Bombus huntii]